MKTTYTYTDGGQKYCDLAILYDGRSLFINTLIHETWIKFETITTTKLSHETFLIAMDRKLKRKPMPMVLEHPDGLSIPNTSILKRRNKDNELTPITSAKTVNFSQHPDGQTNGYHEASKENNEMCDDLDRNGYKENKSYSFNEDDYITTPEKQNIFNWRRNRSHSLPSKKFEKIFVEGSRLFVLRRSNAKDTNMELPTFELR